jgi:hypothetical protein
MYIIITKWGLFNALEIGMVDSIISEAFRSSMFLVTLVHPFHPFSSKGFSPQKKLGGKY